MPLYDASPSDWQEACTTIAPSSFIVADIGSPGGPGTAAAPSWAADIGACGGADVGVLGYVDTGFCQVTLAAAEHQVDEWYSWYGADGVGGIFFDEAADPASPSSEADCLSGTSSAVTYYRSLAAYVHGKSTGQTVAFNFGVNPTSDWPLSSSSAAQNADIAVIFEDPYSAYVDYGGSGTAWAPASWESGYAARHFSILVYGASGAGQPGAVCSRAATQNVGYGYVTPAAGWTGLPPASYLDAEGKGC
jgi:hypothetical protein